MSPADRIAALQSKVSRSTQDFLDLKVREAVSGFESRVDAVLSAKICTDADRDIAAYIRALGYTDIQVTSDFPAYCENYEGRTFVKFSVPTL